MSREISFYTAFNAQFASATLFTPTLATTSEELAPSDFPAFSLQLGKSNYHGLDNDGFLHLGSQEFTLRIFYRGAQLKQFEALNLRSIHLSLIESFISNSFTPMPFSGDESYRINSTEIIEILAPIYDMLLTTHTLTVKGRYHYVFV